MILNHENPFCNDLLSVQLDDGILDLSWSIDTDSLKQQLMDNSITRILNLRDQIDFDIQIDNVDTFDSINLRTFTFSEQTQKYKGNIVYSVIIPFNKNKFEETEYYFRVKINDSSNNYNVILNDEEIVLDLALNDIWSNPFKFTIRKNYTKDLVDLMYKTVADANAYNKEVNSANFYYIFQAIAQTLDKEFKYIQDENDRLFINKSLPDMLVETFGILFKFTNIYNLSMEEYRRIIRHLIIGYQNGGAWNYIKEVLKYLIGNTPELFTLKEFYPWILRKKSIQDPEQWDDRNYYNPQTNFYLYKRNSEANPKDKNLIMLTNNETKNFTFIVKASNFFNLDIDNEKIKTILNLLKSVYTKYILNIDSYKEPLTFKNYIYLADDEILLSNDNEYIKY